MKRPSSGLALPALALYSVFLLAALVWTWRRPAGPWLWDLPELRGGLLRLGYGAGLALAVIGFSEYGRRHWRWTRHLEGEFRNVLGPLSDLDILVLALSSGIAEEAFFRGALQTSFARPAAGLIVATAVFGVIHFPARPGFGSWTAFATVLGLALGLLYHGTGDLVAPVTAHVGINFVNLHRISGRLSTCQG